MSACTRDDEGPTVTLTVPAGDTVAGGVALEMAADGITIEEAGEARDAGHSQDDWCKVAGEVNVLFEETDNGDAPFADRQIAYENIHRLAQQLDDGLDEVDSSARASVGRAIGAVLDLTGAYTATDDEEAAFAAVMTVLEAAETEMTAAAVWIDDTCGISIDS